MMYNLAQFSPMAPKSKDRRVGLGEPLATEFAAFREAFGGGNSEVGVLREAVRLYIDAKVGKDDELRVRYEAAWRRMLGPKKPRLVKGDKA